MQYSISAANYLFMADDMDNLSLPTALKAYRAKLFVLTIDPERLATIRDELLSESRYASLRQCRIEINKVESLFRKNNIRYLNSTNHSAEGIAAKIMDVLVMSRRMY